MAGGLRGVATLVGVGVSGFLGGLVSERYQLWNFPPHGVINAASPMPPKEVLPIPQADQWPSEGPGKSRVSQIMKFGFPGMDNIKSFSDFVVSYDRRNRVPHWVFEHMTRESVKHNPAVDRSKCDFFEDTSVHVFHRSMNSDYKGSGYDRGHMAAAGNHKLAQRFVEETFVLSNMAPQVGKGFNRDSWNRLEKYTRGLTKKYDNVYVCTGPLYLPRREENGKTYVKYEVIGRNNVAVPTHFFKVVLCESMSSGVMDMESYIMPNQRIDDNAPLEAFRVPIDAIERAAGLLFFSSVPKGSFRLINGRKC